ncbi:EAL domain-containing protein (plasmid) [Comamonadaceae bacterium OTU4NAUVB1]|nr:EAL domain-containing protein [Comamonadaceae bacterium OTU4NAUVB1]
MLNVLLGRQPIVDRTGALVAYELLFRSDTNNAAVIVDDHAATAQVILNAVVEFGLASTLGAHRGFVNIGRASFGSDSLLLLEAERFTLEILEDVVIDAEVEAACVRLRQAGFQIALDDVITEQRIPKQVLDLVDIVKIDVRATTKSDLPGLIARAHAAGCLVLAEKVETQEEHRHIRDLGADLFQGYFFARPEMLHQVRVSASHTALLKLNSVLAGEPSLEDMRSEVKRNPVLLAQLMKFAGSAGSAGRADLTVCEAIARVGTRQLGRLAQLLLFAVDGQQQLENNPLLQLVHTRARFMELMADEVRPDDEVFADMAFQTGVFSLMHVVTRQPCAQLLEQIGTSACIQLAILRSEGDLGDLLRIAAIMEGFASVESSQTLARCGIGKGRLSTLFAMAATSMLNGV